MSPSLVQTKLSLKLHFDNIWAGTYCTFAKVVGKNDIYVFGLNNYNQIGKVHVFSYVRYLLWFYSIFYFIGLSSTSTHYSPTLSKDFSSRKWKQICCAQHHTIALSEDGKVYAIGRKEYGRLGLGENCEDAVALKEIKSLENKKCTYIACGSATSFAVTEKGRQKCFYCTC